MTCAYCGEREATTTDDGRPSCRECVLGPTDLAAFTLDEAECLTVTVQ